VLARYKARGFSLNSLCLALQSPLAFDPETGERLPSYMVADTNAIRKGELGAGTISEILPLRVPDCYARGLPYHDCQFAYDIMTGRKLTREQLAKIEAARSIFDRKMAEIKRNGAYMTECGCQEDNLQHEFSTTARCRLEKVPRCANNDNEVLIVGTLRAEGYFLSSQFGQGGITLIDISPSLPLGYGYQLYTDGTAGPGGGDEKTALDRSRRATNAKVLAALEDM
jgi:hypothetical protein